MPDYLPTPLAPYHLNPQGSQMKSNEPCARCGLPQNEHHHDGAAYGVCGKWEASVPIEQASPNELARLLESAVANGGKADSKLMLRAAHMLKGLRRALGKSQYWAEYMAEDYEQFTEDTRADYLNDTGYIKAVMSYG